MADLERIAQRATLEPRWNLRLASDFSRKVELLENETDFLKDLIRIAYGETIKGFREVDTYVSHMVDHRLIGEGVGEYVAGLYNEYFSWATGLEEEGLLDRKEKSRARERALGHKADMRIIKRKLELVRMTGDVRVIEYNTPGPFPKVSSPPGI